MKSNISALPPGHLASAARLAHAIRGELCCAIFLYGLGDRSDEVLTTIAYGKIVYDALERPLPSPPEVDPAEWNTALDRIVDRFGYAALRTLASAA